MHPTHPQAEAVVARDEVVVEEVVVGLADGLQQARALLLNERAAVQPQSKRVQPLLCVQAACRECGQLITKP